VMRQCAMIPMLAISALLAVPLAAQDNRKDRDFQWLYREHHGDGTETPTAIFLSWNYTSVIFRASCERGRGSFDLKYYPDDSVGQRGTNNVLVASSFPPMALERKGESRSAKIRVDGDAVTANFVVDDALLNILAPGSEELLIIAENVAGEPWFVGEATPLYQIAKACR
jgi:hypothetical protein